MIRGGAWLVSEKKAASCEQFSQGKTCNPGQTSVANSHETKFVVDLCLHLTSNQVPPVNVGIITHLPTKVLSKGVARQPETKMTFKCLTILPPPPPAGRRKNWHVKSKILDMTFLSDTIEHSQQGWSLWQKVY